MKVVSKQRLARLENRSQCVVVMRLFRSGNLRLLYLLALAQLVGGPLILLQVTVFCQLTLKQAPTSGWPQAVGQVWNSAEFEEVLQASAHREKHPRKSEPSPGDSSQPEKSKPPMIAWEPGMPGRLAGGLPCVDRMNEAFWTPAWPHAPPGPPPRIG